MQIGILSDTHGHATLTLEALRILRPFELAALLHCGDIGSSDLIALFENWPTHFVFGNVDRRVDELEAAILKAGQTCHGRWGELEFGAIRIAFLHGDDAARLDQASHCGEWDLVCYGHTHQAACERVGKTVVLNPGAVFRATPHSVAVVDLPSLHVEHLTW